MTEYGLLRVAHRDYETHVGRVMEQNTPVDELRMYLDSGVLLDLADSLLGSKARKWSAPEAQKFVDSANEAGATLIISLGHFADWIDADASTRARVASLIMLFQRRALLYGDALRGPMELLRKDAMGDYWDLNLIQLEDPIAVIADLEASARSLANENRRIHSLREKLYNGLRATGRSKSMINALLRTLLVPVWKLPSSLLSVHQLSKSEQPRLQFLDYVRFAWWRRPIRRFLESEALKHAISVDELVRVAVESPECIQFGFANPREFGSWLERARVIAPGIYLSAIYTRENERNRERRPQPGDRMDVFHVTVIPYVNIATVDRNVFKALERGLSCVDLQRRTRVRPNPRTASELFELVACVE